MAVPKKREIPDFVFKPIERNDIAERIKAERERLQIELKRAKNGVGQVLDTVGLEFESVGLTQKAGSGILASLPMGLGFNFKVHRDASSEMFGYPIGLFGRGNRAEKVVSFNAHTPEARKLFRSTNMEKYGFELISNPLDIRTAELAIWALLPKLEYSGDFFSKRCASHIHVGMMKNLEVAKKILRLGLWADELFYALSGMGGEYRGSINNSIYARPLISGPYIQNRGSFYQILNWERALAAESFSDFFTAYHIDINNNAGKFHPARYFGINIYSILVHGTLEFRHFNQSFNPALVCAITKLCQLFSEISIKSKERDLLSLEPGNTFETCSPTHYENKLDIIMRLARNADCTYSLNERDLNELITVIGNYRGLGLRDVPVLTHCKEFTPDRELIAEGKLKFSKIEPIPDGHLDIHIIKDMNIDII